MNFKGDDISKALKKGVFTHIVGRRILYFKELDSTMNKAQEEAKKGTNDGTVILAGRQTAGRGRFKRPWISSPGNILMSIVFYPSLKALPYISVIAALAVLRTIRKETNLKPVIKWPNDVLVQQKKISGLLVESVLEGDLVKHTVVGIGINVSLNPKHTPEIATKATSLEIETMAKVDVGQFIQVLMHEFDNLYMDLKKDNYPINEWRDHLETLGKNVEVVLGNDVIEGYAEDVDSMGHLLIRRPDGKVVTLTAGEVTLNAIANRNTTQEDIC